VNKIALVVDDSQTVRQQVGAALGQAGFEVVEASDGLEALEVLQRQNGTSIVICDVNMPRMNGLDFLAQMKQKAEYASIPVLMLTTEGQPQLVERARKSGAKGWLVKPFKADLLVAAAKKLTATA
jgi:two-component system chemotaxis response regulator CheY